jgi:hypothetical protein
MMKRVNEIEYRPVCASEEIAWQTLIRLDALCNMLSSLVEHIAERDKVTTESHVVSIQKDGEVKDDICKPKNKSKKTNSR